MFLYWIEKYRYVSFQQYLINKKGSQSLITLMTLLLNEDKTETEFQHRLLEETMLKTDVTHLLDENYLLGLCTFDGVGVKQDLAYALTLFQKGALQNHAPSQCIMGTFLEAGLLIPLAPIASFDARRKAALQGYAPALFLLARHYELGFGCKKDLELARTYYQQSAAKQDAMGCFVFSEYLLKGNGIEKDAKKAIETLSMAADLGHPEAKYRLYFHYRDGHIVEQNGVLSRKYLGEAAAQNHSEALNEAGVLYELGKGTKADLKMATELYAAGFQYGSKRAQHNLGRCYLNGLGVPKDEKMAFDIFNTFSEGENEYEPILKNLCVCYEKGLGVEKSEMQTFLHYRGAAIQGKYPWAQRALSLHYAQGIGLYKDLDRACLLLLGIMITEDNSEDLAHLKQYHELDKTTPSDLKQSIDGYINTLGQSHLGQSHLGQNLKSVNSVKDYELRLMKAKANDLLGFCHEYGLGMKQDLRKAHIYYQEAMGLYLKLSTEAPSPYVLQKLAHIFETGIYGVPQNLFKSYKYYGQWMKLTPSCKPGKKIGSEQESELEKEKGKELKEYGEDHLLLKNIHKTIDQGLLLYFNTLEKRKNQYPRQLTAIMAEYAFDRQTLRKKSSDAVSHPSNPMNRLNRLWHSITKKL